MPNTARDTFRDARDTARDASKAAASGARDVQEDLEALRDDVAKLTQQIADLLAAKGNVAWRRAKSNVEGVIAGAEAKGQDAVEAVREASDNVVDAVGQSLKDRPYTTLLLAAGIGFLMGATWRR